MRVWATMGCPEKISENLGKQGLLMNCVPDKSVPNNYRNSNRTFIVYLLVSFSFSLSAFVRKVFCIFLPWNMLSAKIPHSSMFTPVSLKAYRSSQLPPFEFTALLWLDKAGMASVGRIVFCGLFGGWSAVMFFNSCARIEFLRL